MFLRTAFKVECANQDRRFLSDLCQSNTVQLGPNEQAKRCWMQNSLEPRFNLKVMSHLTKFNLDCVDFHQIKLV